MFQGYLFISTIRSFTRMS